MEEEIIIDELENNSDLSYLDYGEDFVVLFHKGIFVCNIEVFTDRENGSREYICVNNEVTYLEDLKKQN